jgi:hypothetical protein
MTTNRLLVFVQEIFTKCASCVFIFGLFNDAVSMSYCSVDWYDASVVNANVDTLFPNLVSRAVARYLLVRWVDRDSGLAAAEQ